MPKYRLSPGEVACSHFACVAQPGLPCLNEDETRFLVDDKPDFHAERKAAADFENGVSEPVVSLEQFSLAVEESGLF